MKTYLFTAFISIFFWSLVHAGQENYVNRLEGNSILVNATYSTYDSHYSEMLNSNWPTLFTNKKVSNYVRLGIRPDVVQNATYSGSIQVQIDYQTWGSSGTYTSNSVTKTLSISYDVNGNNPILDASTYTFVNAHFVKAKVLAITGLDVENVYLETGIDVERYYPFNNQTTVVANITEVPQNTLEITWEPIPGAEFYEIEYVHVNKYTLTNLNYVSTTDLTYNFYLNSTRVEVATTYYRLPKIFDRGYFVYRIRAVGKKGTNYTERNDGAWSSPESGTVAFLLGFNAGNVFHITSEYDPQMNWSHQVAFTEGGKRLEGVSFSDGLGRGRQQVGLNAENGQVIVSNVYYDELGRPAVSDIPTPVSSDYLHHFPDFNRANVLVNGVYPSYQYEYFNESGTTCPVNSIGFSTTQGAGKYYSNANTSQDGANAVIPDAETYPFSRVTYQNDFTGRLDRVSAAGAPLKMGSGKETQYIYSSPTQTELNELFGVEVGEYARYEKLLTIDPNGQVYVQYTDMAGRVVASYMEGQSPPGLTPLADNTVVPTTIPLLSPGDDQNIDLTVPSSQVTAYKYISNPGNYTFSYGFTPAQYQNMCLASGLCFDCVYDLELKILDECSAVVYDSTLTVNGSTFDALCNAGSFDTLSVDLILTKQNYRITKKLSVNQASIDAYWCLYLENNTCISPLTSIFNSYYANEGFENCDPVVLDSIPEEAGPCDGYREAMLADLRPGGQYAKYTISSTGVYTASEAWSVLTAYSTNAYSGTIDWQHPPSPYLDQNGVNVTGSVTSQGLNYFVMNFRPEWAELFLPYHPEYCHLQFCQNNGTSQAYDAAMAGIIEFDAAISDGYFEPVGETDIAYICSTIKDQFTASETRKDPFFTTTPGSGYLTQMNNDLNNYITLDGTAWGGTNVTLNLWQYAIYLSQNCSPSVNPITCLRDTCNTCNYDQVWLSFRDMYLELKSKYVMLAQEAYAHANCPASACIGVNPTTCTGNNALLAGKIPNFVNTGMYDDILDAANPSAVYGQMVQDNCQISCEEFADQWITDLAGCDLAGILNPTDQNHLRQDLIDLCMAGCTTTHPVGSSTAPPGSTYVTINEVLEHYLGSDFETSLCSDLLISEPGPYEAISQESAGVLQAPLDTCGCNYYLDHSRDYQQAIAGGTVPIGVDNLEEWISYRTGVLIEDVDPILCACAKFQSENTWESGANAGLIASGVMIPANISCDQGVDCIDCSQLDAGIGVLINQLGDVDNLTELQQTSNYQVILENYFNRTYGFQLTGWDYMDFISRCHATSSNPYCVDNPLVSEWMLQMSLLSIRGQLTSSINNLDLITQNIVYKQGELRGNGLGNILNSSQTGNALTLTYSGAGYTSCTYRLSLPAGATFGFEDIVAFEDFEVSGTSCGNYEDFTCTVAYYECGVKKYADLTVTTSCMPVKTCYCSSEGQTLCYDPFAVSYSACYQPELNLLMTMAFDAYEQTIQETYAQFETSYKSTCAAAFQTEHEELKGSFAQYQYTLFYYDQAGNLARTVAPEGVHKLPVSNNALINSTREAVVSSTNYPDPTTTAGALTSHDYVTKYKYNSYNQLVSTTNPDQTHATNPSLAGETRYWYDFYGRLVASQNPVQASQNKYSYVLFDALGRPVQSGQTVRTVAPSETMLKTNDYGTGFKTWVEAGTRTEVTVTQYDKSLSTAVSAKFASGTQDNLRLRVASVLYFASVSGTTNWQTDYETATHYSYDIHGNVKEQIQDVPMLATVGQNNKSTQYEYELVSGNVTKVSYQKDKADQVTHRYTYDKLNRLRDAYTSTNSVYNDRQAKYLYYDYGPLARVELGQNKVQSMDYVYTINGWIKGMNASTLNISRDAGKDAGFGYFAANNQQHFEHAADAVGYTLGYFDGDYKPIASGTGFEAAYGGTAFGNGAPNLYNGNIRNLVTSITGMDPMGSAYKYDQLNRLVGMDAYFNTSGLASSNNWSAGTLSQAYKSTYAYDRNGNLKHLLRNGPATQLAMDDFTYWYDNSPSGKPWNRLDRVTDNVTVTTGFDDIKNGQSDGNYGYDALGQLTSDASEGIQFITWRSGDKKVQKIARNSTKPNAPQLEFIYNPFGQRVLKIEKPRVSGVLQADNTWKYTYYSYDANGQVLAVYDLALGSSTKKADLNELHLYGASRLGVMEHPVSLWNNGAVAYTPANPIQHVSGETRYEISNYLGNVNAVVSDRKVPAVNYVKNAFSSTTESWTASGATLSASAGLLKITASSSTNSTSKTFTTTVGKRYFLRILSDKGTAAALRVSGTGITTTTLGNLQVSNVSFTATSASTTVTLSPTTSGVYTYYMDRFELIEDHLYDLVVKMTSDYYPFGMAMPGRNTNLSDYRFGYNGMEMDNEAKGNGNSYTTEFRQYDPRLGRWLSLDPLMMQFPEMSPYVAFDNNPVYFVDPYGLEPDNPDWEDPNPDAGSEHADRGGIDNPNIDYLSESNNYKKGLPESNSVMFNWRANTVTDKWGSTARAAMSKDPVIRDKLNSVLNLANIRKKYMETTYGYKGETNGEADVTFDVFNDDGGTGFILFMYYITKKGNKVGTSIILYVYNKAYDDGYGMMDAQLSKIDLADVKNLYTSCYADALGLKGNVTSPYTVLQDEYQKSSKMKIGDVGLYQVNYPGMAPEAIHMIKIIGKNQAGEFIYRSNWIGAEAIEGTWEQLQNQFEEHGMYNLKPSNLLWYGKKK